MFWSSVGSKEWGVLFESEKTVIEFNSAMERIGMLVLKVKVLWHAILRAQAGDSGWQMFNAKEF